MNKKIIINKFGGAIMGDARLLALAADRVKEQYKDGSSPIVVVSALKGVTDELISILYNLKQQMKDNGNRHYPDELIKLFMKDAKDRHFAMMSALNLSGAYKDSLTVKFTEIFNELEEDLGVIRKFGLLDVFQAKILAYGERLASWLFSHLLESRGVTSVRIGEEAGIATDSVFLDANIFFDKSSLNVCKFLKDEERVPVVAGFIGKNEDGQITVLGRGGSDTTACFLGAAMKAESVILWKEVDGVLSADPKIVPSAKTVPYISYEEAEESGKVICDKAIQYLKMFSLKGIAASLTNPSIRTEIGPRTEAEKGVKIISSKKDLTLVIITDEGVKEYGFLYQISKIFTNHKVNMALIRNTRDRLYIVVENNGGSDKVSASLDELKQFHFGLEVMQVSMVTVIGNLDFGAANTFNDTLCSLCPNAPIGGFPYKDCVRLEAVVKNEELEIVIRGFHKVFIART
ncbi:MAG: Aspartokinase [Parcubacteria group bacterium GW2011_GWA2_44_12]|nr:MAG: Aspartokinase [Parcubacteria group bacterium GW2011_GWA2_44_12]